MTYGLVLGSCIFCTVLTLAVYALCLLYTSDAADE